MRNLGQATDPAPLQYYVEPAILVYDVVLLASQVLNSQPVPIDGDSDFEWLALAGTSTGIFDINIQLASGRRLGNAWMNSVNVVGTAQFPVALPVGALFPRSGAINVDIRDTSVAGNTVQLCFHGLKRFAVR